MQSKSGPISSALIIRTLKVVMSLSSLVLTASAPNADEIERNIKIADIERHYLIHLPPNALYEHNFPLVVLFHGGGGNAQLVSRQTHFNEQADRSGFIVAYPDGTDRFRPLLKLAGKPGFLTWNAGECCGYAMEHQIDDVGFIRAIVAQMERDYPIERKQIYAAGISNGGMMAYRLACEASDIFAAVGVVSGVLVKHPCTPQAPVSVIDFHGANDQYVPIDGGIGPKSLSGTLFPPVRESIFFWAKQDECEQPPEVLDRKGVISNT